MVSTGFYAEPPMGFEPTTCSLRVSCSTAELRRQNTTIEKKVGVTGLEPATSTSRT